ncbi:uncharacterized protein AB675_9590 [Cyphellophora attinorum]|uniref:DUF7918 domain-containing protein n=1 Tax=Cyphellophora attinorum TaxID=1664694 RepID=A0A0N0NPB5_9EURO|nr:uncharacterized protein AB675_9590 [Phialophora attinorum]KPI42561.1 hypothetical protein AB675_9590 [Phialophora attinorum]
MPELEGATVRVLTGDRPDDHAAREYEDNEQTDDPEQPRHIVRYIDIESGTPFCFKIHIHRKFSWQGADAIEAAAYLDGKFARVILFGKPTFDPKKHFSFSSHLDGSWSGVGHAAKHHRWVFADLETRDKTASDDTATWKNKYGDLGKLTVKLYRCQKIGAQQETTHNYFAVGQQTDLVPEKALKGRPLDATTSFMAGTAGVGPRTQDRRRLDHHPFATFDFLYRTRRALQALLIIERSPTPVPLEERDPETLTRQELLQLERQRRAAEALKKERGSVKRERDGNDSPSPTHLKSIKGADGQKIYLLDSDDEDTDDDGLEVISAPKKEAPEVVDLLD